MFLYVFVVVIIFGDERCGGGGEFGNFRVFVVGGDEIVELCY